MTILCWYIVLPDLAGGCTAKEKGAFAGVLSQGGGLLEVVASFGIAAQFVEEVGADAGQKVVAVERWVSGQGFYKVEGGLRAGDHGDGYGSVELYDRGWG